MMKAISRVMIEKHLDSTHPGVFQYYAFVVSPNGKKQFIAQSERPEFVLEAAAKEMALWS